MTTAYRRAEVLRAISTLNLTAVPATAKRIVELCSDPKPSVQVVHRILRDLRRDRRIEAFKRTEEGHLWRRTVDPVDDVNRRSILAMLVEVDDPIGMTVEQLQQSLDLSRETLRRQLNTLHDLGLVERGESVIVNAAVWRPTDRARNAQEMNPCPSV